MALAFFTLAELKAEISEPAVTRLLVESGSFDQRCWDASAHVVALIFGYNYPEADLPSPIPREWSRLARQWAFGQLVVDFPEYFRVDGPARCKEVDRQILQSRAVEPSDGLTHVASIKGEDWDSSC